MSHMKRIIKHILRNFGIDIIKFTPDKSSDALLKKIIEFLEIDLIIDVGANEGQFIELVRSLGYNKKIISIEPLSKAFKILENKFSGRSNFEAYNFALGNFDGKSEINVSENSFSSSLLNIHENHLNAAPQSKFIKKENIEVRKLDSMKDEFKLNDAKSIFLKLDVQGFEKHVLEGSLENLSKIKLISTEMSLVPLYHTSTLFIDLIQFMQKNGFDFYAVEREFTDSRNGRVLQLNGYFVNINSLEPTYLLKRKE